MKRYVITTVIPESEINTFFYRALLSYCKKNKAELKLLATDAKDLGSWATHPALLHEELKLNNNLYLSTLPVKAEQVDPVKGTDRVYGANVSAIFASPKQRLKSIASPLEDMPRVMMTPGSISKPLLKGSKRSVLAARDHVYGAIVVEIEDKEVFHFRQVQAGGDGSFVDLGVRYLANGKTKEEQLEALIPGDYHVGSTDPAVRKVILQVLKKYQPKHLVLHDFADFLSINHHIDHQVLTKARLGDQNDLSKELQSIAFELKFLADRVENVTIVKSNHDEFLDGWLNEGKYVTDARNHIAGLELALAKARGHDPLEYAVRQRFDYTNVKFLETDESFKISGIECGTHGHKGSNGARGSVNNLEKVHQSLVQGHSHTPEILRQAWVVGTSTFLRLGYNKGPSSWLNTMCLVYANGSRQLINVIRGKCIV